MSISYLVADLVVLAIHLGLGIGRQRRKIDRASRSHRACNYELDKVSAIRAHAFPSTALVAASHSSVPGLRNRYQSKISPNEKTKMIVEMALISGVIPRRSRDHISSGNVLSRPMRKKLTAISSIDNVKISNAAPMIASFRFGSVTRQKVCQYVAPRSSDASS